MPATCIGPKTNLISSLLSSFASHSSFSSDSSLFSEFSSGSSALSELSSFSANSVWFSTFSVSFSQFAESFSTFEPFSEVSSKMKSSGSWSLSSSQSDKRYFHEVYKKFWQLSIWKRDYEKALVQFFNKI